MVFLSSLVVAFYFGTQLKTDFFFFAYNLVVLFSGFLSSLNASVLIPEAMRIRIRRDEKTSMRFLNFFLVLYIILTVIIGVILLIYPQKIFLFISNFDSSAVAVNRKLIFLLVPVFVLMPVSGLLSEILASYRFFTIPMIIGIINGLFSILFVIFFHSTLDTLSMMLALVVSYSINLGILVYLMIRRIGWQFTLFDFHIEKRIWRNIGFAQAGNITSVLYSYAPIFLFSGLRAGVVTAFALAQQIASMPTVLITNQFSAVSGVKLNELYAKGEFDSFREVFARTTNFLVFLLMPVSGILFLFASDIVAILFKRGAFNQESVEQCTVFLRLLGLLLPAIAINTMVARVFMATHSIKQSFWYQVCLNVALVVLIYVGVKEFGMNGYLYAMLTIYGLSTILLYYLANAFFPEIRYGLVLRHFFSLLFVNALIVAVLDQLNLTSININSYVRILLGVVLYGSLLLIFNHFLKINLELAGFSRRIKQLIYKN